MEHESETRFHELETKYINALEERDAALGQIHKIQTEKDNLASTIASYQSNAEELQIQIIEFKNQSSRTKVELQQFVQEKQDLVSIIEKRDAEISTIKEERDLSEERSQQLQRTNIELQTKLNEFDSQITTLRFEQIKYQREKESLEQQNTWLNESLSTKTNELLELKKEKANQLFELKSKLEETLEDNNNKNSTIEQCKKQIFDLEKKLVTTLEQLKDSKDTFLTSQERFNQEIQTQVKLQELYKNAEESAKQRLKELESAIEELENMNRKNIEFVNKAQQSTTSLEREIQILTEENSQLKDRLIATEMIQQPILSTPTSLERRPKKSTLAEDSNISPGEKTRQGILIETQEQLEEVTRELQLERNENRKLTNQLNYILKEIESKAPVIQKYKEDYEKMSSTHNLLTRQLESAMKQCEEYKQQHSKLQRENTKLDQQCQDLSRQVQLLLKESINNVNKEESTFATSNVVTSDQIIQDNLVTFKDIQELQQKNIQLLATIRELSSEQEQQAQQIRDQKLEQAYRELQELKDTRTKQTEMMELIVRQRDMYKVLAESKSTKSTVPTLPTNIIESQSQNSTDYQKMLNDLQEDYESYRKEKNESEKLNNEQLVKVKEEAGAFKLELAKANTKIDFLNERYNLLVENTESQRKELDVLRKKNMEFSTSVVLHQQKLEQINQDLGQAREEVRKLEGLNIALKSEKEVIKNSETRMHMELEQVKKERNQEKIMIENLQHLLQAKESSDSQLRQHLLNQLETLQKESNNLKKQITEEREAHKKLTDDFDIQIKDLQSKIKIKDKERQQLSEDLIKSSLTLQNIQQQLSDTKQQLSKTESQLSYFIEKQRESVSLSSTSPEDLLQQQLQQELSSIKLELQNYKEQLLQEKENTAHYKAIAIANEQALKEMSELSDTYKQTFQSKIDEANGQTEKHLSTIKELQDTLQSTREIFNGERDLMNTKIDSLTIQLKETKSEKELLQTNMSQVEEREKLLQDDIHLHAQLAKDAQANYERELMLHAADVQSLSNLKEQIQVFENKVRSLEQELSVIQDSIKIKELSWEEQKQNLSKQIQDMEVRVKSLTDQNDLLHSQLDTVTSQAVKIQQHQQDLDSIESNANLLSSEDKTIKELRELIRFLRSDKEILECKYELVQQETLRYKQQVEFNQKEIKDLEEKVRQEQAKSLSRIQSEEQHKELMDQLQQLNLLRESNIMLRDENQRNLRKLKELQDKISSLEASISPLLEQKKSLTAQQEILLEEKKSLENEINTWKSRVQQLMDKYQRIDPETHKKLQEDLQSITQQLSDKVAELEASKQDLLKLKSVNAQAVKIKKKNEELQEQINQLTQQTQSESTSKEELLQKNLLLQASITKLENERTNMLSQYEQYKTKAKSLVEQKKKEILNLKEQLKKSSSALSTSSTTVDTQSTKPTPTVPLTPTPQVTNPSVAPITAETNEQIVVPPTTPVVVSEVPLAEPEPNTPQQTATTTIVDQPTKKQKVEVPAVEKEKELDAPPTPMDQSTSTPPPTENNNNATEFQALDQQQEVVTTSSDSMNTDETTSESEVDSTTSARTRPVKRKLSGGKTSTIPTDSASVVGNTSAVSQSHKKGGGPVKLRRPTPTTTSVLDTSDSNTTENTTDSETTTTTTTTTSSTIDSQQEDNENKNQ